MPLDKPPDALVFFLDRSIGKRVIAEALIKEGIEAAIHDDYFEKDTKDSEWLSVLGKREWVVLTKDK